jgi:hypothetical protein
MDRFPTIPKRPRTSDELLQQMDAELVAAVFDDEASKKLALRVEELAQKSTAGTLTPEEYDEYARIVRMNDVLSLMRVENEELWQFLEENGGKLPPGSIDRP